MKPGNTTGILFNRATFLPRMLLYTSQLWPQ